MKSDLEKLIARFKRDSNDSLIGMKQGEYIIRCWWSNYHYEICYGGPGMKLMDVIARVTIDDSIDYHDQWRTAKNEAINYLTSLLNNNK